MEDEKNRMHQVAQILFAHGEQRRKAKKKNLRIWRKSKPVSKEAETLRLKMQFCPGTIVPASRPMQRH